ncbi:hypothetical protein [Gabonibacter massiliensis]|uniref:hypothetical protein n=1 Tax=Gabonibacter massiliensis TaxID=1720195 RepID=UPI00073E410B|nr:hypothetical protein [Gabonibacter massiliensis]
MKINILFVLILFLSFTGFRSQEVEKINDVNISKILLFASPSKPVVNHTTPKDGNVKGFVGQIVKFEINFTANPEATYKIYKNGELWQSSEDVSFTNKVLTIKLLSAALEDSGEYKIVLKNSVGETEVIFKVKIYPDK